MTSKLAVIMAALALSVGFCKAQSESVKTLWCKDNRVPELHAFEVGSRFDYIQYDESPSVPALSWRRKETTVTPYARYGLLENITAYSTIPVGFNRSDKVGDANGLRDITMGIELLAYEFTYKYPWVMPYVEISAPTGDEDKYLGQGNWDGVFGTAVGTTVHDIYHYVLDGRYNVEGKWNDNTNNDGVFTLASAFIWDVGPRFSVFAEGKVTSEDIPAKSGVPLYGNGGMSYKFTDSLVLNWYGGASANTTERGHAGMKVAYSF